jgi:hypothetical protein
VRNLVEGRRDDVLVDFHSLRDAGRFVAARLRPWKEPVRCPSARIQIVAPALFRLASISPAGSESLHLNS